MANDPGPENALWRTAGCSGSTDAWQAFAEGSR